MPFYTPTATPVESVFLPPPIESGKAAMLYEGDVWLVTPSRPPQRLTRSGDIRRLFGWNHSGNLLLMSRKREVLSAEGVETVYSLWVYDTARGIEYKRSVDMAYFIAGWSPAGDQIAVYTGKTRITKIIDLNGNLLHELDYTLGNFAWSPDGSKLAIATFTDAHLNQDGEAYNNISIWDLGAGQVTPYNDATDEVQHQPVWSLDSTTLIFQRSPVNDDVGWELWDIRSGERATLFQTETFSLDVSRSPCSDQVIYRSRSELMPVDFRGEPRRIAEAETFFWLPDCSGVMVLNDGVDFGKIKLGDPEDQFVTYGGNPIWRIGDPTYFIAR